MEKYNKIVRNILAVAENEMFDLRHPYVGTEHLLLSLLKCKNISNISFKYGLTYKVFKNELEKVVGHASKKSEVVLYTPLLKSVLKESLEYSNQNNICFDELLLFKTLLSSDDGIALRLLVCLNIDIDELLDSIVLNEESKVNNILIGREEEISHIIEVLLRKNKNNPLLIGEAGVGKSAIVYELANRLRCNNVPDLLKGYSIKFIDMGNLLANTKYRGEFEAKIEALISEVKSKRNIILFVDEIHTLMRTGGGEGTIDAANILKPYLTNGDIKLIGATTLKEYDEYISGDKAFARRFEKVVINEPNYEMTLDILKGLKKSYEDFYKLHISNKNLEDIVKISNEYINNNCNPDKSIDLLDSVCSKKLLSNNKGKNITYKDIINTMESITGIHIIDKTYKLKLVNNLKKYNSFDLNKVLINILDNNNFVNNICVIGKESKDKEELGKIISDSLKYNYLTIDLKDYSSPSSIVKLVGNDNNYVYGSSALLDAVKYKPYTFLYLKNYDLGSTLIQKLFDDIITDGEIRNSRGDIISFKHSFIFKSINSLTYKIGFNSENLLSNYVFFENDKVSMI